MKKLLLFAVFFQVYVFSLFTPPWLYSLPISPFQKWFLHQNFKMGIDELNHPTIDRQSNIVACPNPVFNLFDLFGLPKNSWNTISIYNVKGEKVLEQICLSTTVILDLNDLVKGVYLVQIKGKITKILKIFKP